MKLLVVFGGLYLLLTYTDIVAGNGAIQVKEQVICILWNSSVDEKLRILIAGSEILHLLIKSLVDEHMKVKEAAVGVLANLTLSQSNHNIMVEAGVNPMLVLSLFSSNQRTIYMMARLWTTNLEESLVIKKAARNAFG